MKKLTALLILAAVVVAAQAQLLWKVSGNGAAEPSYIFGTHHIAPLSMLDSVPGLRQAIGECQVVYGEIDTRTMSDMPQVMALQKRMIAPADSTLDKVLSPRAYAYLDSLATDLTGVPGFLNNFKPFAPAAVTSQLSVMMAKRNMPGNDIPLDKKIQDIALESGKEVRGFETMADQAEMLFGVPIAVQAAEIEQAVKDGTINPEASKRLNEAYLTQNFPAIEAIVTGEPMPAEKRNRLLWQRNIRWAETLDAPLKQGRLLIAVGAGHLTGPLSVIERLRKIGYTVTPAQ